MNSRQATLAKEVVDAPEIRGFLDNAAVSRRIDFLKSTPLFSTLSDKQIVSIAEVASDQFVKNGSFVFHEGDTGSEMYIVFAGEVEVVKESAGGKVIYVAKAGEILGEIAVLTEIRRTASLRARGDVRLIRLKGRHFIELLRRNPDISIEVVKILARRLASTQRAA